MGISSRSLFLPRLVAAVVALLGAGALWVSASDLMVSQGPASLATLYRPPLWTRLLALGLLVGATTGGLAALLRPVGLRRPGGGWAWSALFVFALGSFALSLHTVVINAFDASVHDVWGIWPVQGVTFDGEGVPREAFSRSGPLFLDVGGAPFGRVRIFLGIPPWRIDADTLLSHPVILPGQPSLTGTGTP